VTSIYHPIWIEHRDDFEDYTSAKRLRQGAGRGEEVQKPPHGPGCITLPWMDTGGENYIGALRNSDWAITELCYGEEGERIPR